MTTDDAANADGFFPITGISGARNGVAITALQPAGTSIPGNEPFLVDNLIRAGGPQLTGNGFGFALADGTFANAFFADFLTPPGYLEFFSAPPFAPGVIGPEDSERPVAFTARVPEPATAMVVLVGCLGLLAARRVGRSGAARPPHRGSATRQPALNRLRAPEPSARTYKRAPPPPPAAAAPACRRTTSGAASAWR